MLHFTFLLIWRHIVETFTYSGIFICSIENDFCPSNVEHFNNTIDRVSKKFNSPGLS